MLEILRQPRLLWCLSVGTLLVAIGSTIANVTSSSDFIGNWNWGLIQFRGVTGAAGWCFLPVAILSSARSVATRDGRQGDRRQRRDVRYLLLFGVSSTLVTFSLLVSAFQTLGARPFQGNFLGSIGVQGALALPFWIGSVILAIAVLGLAVRAGFGRLTSPDAKVFVTTALALTGISLATSVVPF